VSEYDEKPARMPGAAALSSMVGVVVGWLDPSSAPGRLCVDFAGNTLGPTPARTTVLLSDAALMQAITSRQGALLVFENADPALPIIIGLLQTQETSLFGALLAPPSEAPSERRREPARLDGESVVVEGKREVVLKSGEASLTLRRDGKVVIRGTYVETYAKGINRIKGGAVKIN
jgi:Domain of unknown function (DUF6484)